MRRNLTALTVVLLVLLVLVSRGIWSLTAGTAQGTHGAAPTGPMPSPPPGLEKFYSQDIVWTSCDVDFECSVLTVPLDYAHPDGRTIELHVERLRTAHPMGAIVMNPGGPGGSGIQYVQAAKQVTTPLLRSKYDLVGFDPRGVGSSTPVQCLDDKQTDAYIAADGSPDTVSEIMYLGALMKDFGARCAKKSPELYDHIDTVSAAKDIDILRNALNQPKLNWFGKSYGTLLGATYADLFPQNVGRMMLDGAIDPALDSRDISHGQAIGFEDALQRFLADCPKHKDCELPRNSRTATAKILAMLLKLDRSAPLLPDGRRFTQSMGLTGIVGGLYDKTYGWTELRSALPAALAGDYAQLAQSVDFYTSRQDDGHFSDNSNSAIVAINCLDHPTHYSTKRAMADATTWSAKAPVFGAYLAWSEVACNDWPAERTPAEHAIAAQGSSLILVVGTTHDPATPYMWAQALADELANAKLLTFDGDGHTAYMQGSQCVDAAVDAYFIAGNPPPTTACTDGP